MPVIHRRRLGIAAGAALMTLAAVSCSGLGRNAVGTVVYESPTGRAVQVSNPLVTGCHRLAPSGAVEITNRTLVDFRLYRTPDCSGDQFTYVATTLSSRIVPGTPAWLSYSIVN
jgi:hypothetical protein